MNNPERKNYPALTQAEIRALYQANPTRAMRRLVWEIYCLHVVIKKAGAVIRARRMQDQLIPGGFDYVLDELAKVLETEIYLHENLPSMHAIYEKRQARTSTKKRNKKAYR
ncbi:hypothetical protein ACN9M1_27775 (plasmid) [Ralstonia sp. R-29]|uniref:hypothetical protein n=1 Tax=Ralstonia sp. R-29 TaxID=3404059 RepID=UPI003CEC691D